MGSNEKGCKMDVNGRQHVDRRRAGKVQSGQCGPRKVRWRRR